MAEKKRSGRAKGVPHHPLVEALASDPNGPPKRATRMFGYPGPAARPDSTRLWLDADLTSYVDVPDGAILYSRTLADDEGTILWVDPEVTLTHSTQQAQEVQAAFLGGEIARRKLADAPFNAEARAGVAPDEVQFRPVVLTIALECPFTYILCRTPLLPCRMLPAGDPVESRAGGCPPEPGEGRITPANPLGPFRPRQ